MAGFVSGSEFGTKAGLRVAIFAGLTFGFPLIVYGLILTTNARSVGGASGALAAVAGIYLKPLIILIFLISLISPCRRRMHSLGLPPSWGLLVPFLFLMDSLFLTVLGAHWGTGFAIGALIVTAPWFALTALAMLVAMAFAAPLGFSPEHPNGGLLRICVGLAVLLIVVSLATSDFVWWLMIMFNPRSLQPSLFLGLAALGYWAQLLKPLVCFAFCVAMAAMAILSRKQAGNVG